VRILLALLREQLVRDALLDVVRLPGEEEQGLVLRFVAKACDGAVVAVAVRVAGGQNEMRAAADAERDLRRRRGLLVRDDRGVGNGLDEAGAERRRRDPEARVVAREVALEVVLLDGAAGGVTGGIHAPADDEQRVHATVARAIGLVLEARLAHRPVQPEERGDGVARAERGRHRHLRIHGWTGAADGGLRVTAGAAVEIEARTETAADPILFGEV